MAIRSKNKIVKDWWTPDSQIGEDKPARFLIEPMSQAEVHNINRFGIVQKAPVNQDDLTLVDDLEEGEEPVPLTPRYVVHPSEEGVEDILRKVLDWENVFEVIDKEGEEDVEVEAKFSKENFHRLIPWDVRQELLREIMSRSNVTVEEKKTS